MESSAEYLERCRAAFKIKSDAHIAREIGVSPQGLHKFKHGEKQLGKEIMIKLAERAGLDPDEALILRALWASQIDTIPNYASILRKITMCFLAGILLSFAPGTTNENTSNYNALTAESSTEATEVINITRLLGKLLLCLFGVCIILARIKRYGLFQFWDYHGKHQLKGRLRLPSPAA